MFSSLKEAFEQWTTTQNSKLESQFSFEEKFVLTNDLPVSPQNWNAIYFDKKSIQNSIKTQLEPVKRMKIGNHPRPVTR